MSDPVRLEPDHPLGPLEFLVKQRVARHGDEVPCPRDAAFPQISQNSLSPFRLRDAKLVDEVVIGLRPHARNECPPPVPDGAHRITPHGESRCPLRREGSRNDGWRLLTVFFIEGSSWEEEARLLSECRRAPTVRQRMPANAGKSPETLVNLVNWRTVWRAGYLSKLL